MSELLAKILFYSLPPSPPLLFMGERVGERR